MIVFGDIKRCQFPHSTQFFQKAKNQAAAKGEAKADKKAAKRGEAAAFTGRRSVAVAVPASIVDNAQSAELRGAKVFVIIYDGNI